MRSDEQIERLLKDWLVEGAEPMPQAVLEEVLDGVSRRSQEQPGTTTGFRWLTRRATSVAGVAVMILVMIIIAPSVVPQLQATWRSVTGAGPEPMHWDAMLQFRENPRQLNPAPDAYGHTVVFTYLRSSGLAHDPSQYVPLPEFESEGTESWYDPALPGLYVGFSLGDDMLTMHPYGSDVDSRAAIVAWRNPVDASLRLSGRVEVDATCGDGIIFSIEHGTSVLETFALPRGSRTFEHDTDPFFAGEVLYFIVEPGADSQCDTTRFNVAIDTQ
ncbi:MAG: hypothetical protein WD116_04520 [Chloroflexota bacterium]